LKRPPDTTTKGEGPQRPNPDAARWSRLYALAVPKRPGKSKPEVVVGVRPGSTNIYGKNVG